MLEFSMPRVCGFRLVSLKHNQVNLNQGVMRVVGKGNAKRLIPLGEEAVKLAAAIHARPASRNSPGTPNGLFFADAPRRSHDAPGFWHIIKRYSKKAGRREGTLSPYVGAMPLRRIY